MTSPRLTPRQRLDRQMGGEQLAADIVDLARLLGYRAIHHRAARTNQGWRTAFVGDAGFPDVVVAGYGRLWFWECKRMSEPMRPGQQEWLDELGDASGSDPHAAARVVRPSDWDWIEATLRAAASSG